MNDGYWSYILLVVMTVLLSSGWRSSVVKGITSLEVLSFIAVWYIGLFSAIPLGSTVSVQGIYLALLLTLVRFMLKEPIATVSYFIITGCLLGLIVFFVQEMYRLDPILIVFQKEIDAALIIGVLAWLVTRQALPQAAVLSLAYIIQDVLPLLSKPSDQMLYLGDAVLQDGWWISYVCARVLTLTGESIVWMLQFVQRRLPRRLKGIRK
ncbi:hypothetical protein PRECH8_01660 [Insulibacter thermoxylanivorax]|uniref:Uncharacterized protein n=1 Tax=Insulibacter thermoxylanivorax TaxID=2749268 RepID=A0A916QA08_9BACL|nr:hypothetical protein [Insulibacter thermoxylanivorax]GFR36870.1 hypothetical protein PRECH8_01660 [Insulibacter thermoxylanivorax]